MSAINRPFWVNNFIMVEVLGELMQ